MAEEVKGRFVWYELMTTEPGAAEAFYAKVCGWGSAPYEVGDQPYTVWMNGEASLGGLMRLPDEAVAAGAPPHWLGYVATDDVDATVEQAKGMGAGVLMGPMDVPEVGRLAVLRDPQGAVFAVYRPAGEAPGHAPPAEMGEVSWHELHTEGWEQAWDFYATLFGWTKTEAMDMGDMGTYQMFATGPDGVTVGGMFDKMPEVPVCHWLFYVQVPDLEAALAAVNEGGGRVLNGPMEVPGGDRVAHCVDPQGAVFALHSPASA
ncbi:MAG: VOC family protein, partial [Gemmatimonadetes bacterium]